MTHLLSSLPTWVYLLFFALLHLGYKQTQTRTVSKTRLTVLPSVWIAFSLYNVLTVPNSTLLALLAWVLGLGFAFFINIHFLHRQPVQITQVGQDYVVPGSWIPMILMMTIFFFKMIQGYLVGNHLVTPHTTNYIIISSCISGLISGSFLARALSIFDMGIVRLTNVVHFNSIQGAK